MNDVERREYKGLAITAGIFLILYALPYLFFGPMRNIVYGFGQITTENLPTLIYSLAFPPAGLFLILRKPKIAAVFVVLAAVSAAVMYFPTIRDFFGDGLIVEYGEYETLVPRFYVLVPILEFAAPLLLASALFLRGCAALALALLAAAAEVTDMVLTFGLTRYYPGHPTPLTVMIPFNFIMAAVFAGIYLLRLGGKQAGDQKQTQK